MPSGDRTGPQGMGPMTGRATGYCAGFPHPGFVNRFGGRGGYGRGRRNRFRATGSVGPPFAGAPAYEAGPAERSGDAAPTSSEQELGFLKQQINALQQTLAKLQERIDQLEPTA